MNNPPIVLADEPTASLDSAAGRQIAELLARLAAEQGKLVIIVSHDPRLLDFGDRVVEINDGGVISDRRAKECVH